MVFFLVNQDDPGKIAWPYIRGAALGYFVAFLAITYVLPWLEDFTSLAIFLVLVLFPAGLMMGTPRLSFFAVGFAAFFIVGVASANQFDPNVKSYLNNAAALLLGLVAFLVVSTAILPVSPRMIRRRAWTKVVGAMASTARGTRTGRVAAQNVLTVLAELLLRLDLTRPREEELLRGCLGAASTCREIGLIFRMNEEPEMPPAIAKAVRDWLGVIAMMYEDLQGPGAAAPITARGEAATRDLYRGLAAAPVPAGSPQARLVIQVAASLRFVLDRFESDRAFLARFDSNPADAPQ